MSRDNTIDAVLLATILLAGISSATAAEVVHDDTGDVIGVTAADALNVREEPSLEAPVVVQLPWGSRVGLHAGTYRSATIGGRQDRWVFVSTAYCADSGCDMLKAGWVADSYIATEDRFVPMLAWRPGEVGAYGGDYAATYAIAADGRFTHSSVPCVPGNCGENREYDVCDDGERREGRDCVGSGQLQRYRNLVRAEGENGQLYGYLFIDTAGALCSVASWVWEGERSCDR